MFVPYITPSLTTKELCSILKELRKISQAEAPAKVKKTKLMSNLFLAAKRENTHFSDWYSEVRSAINSEILWRFEKDKL